MKRTREEAARRVAIKFMVIMAIEILLTFCCIGVAAFTAAPLILKVLLCTVYVIFNVLLYIANERR